VWGKKEKYIKRKLVFENFEVKLLFGRLKCVCGRVVTISLKNIKSELLHVLQGTKELEGAVNLRIS
jgi:hypothetical protein